MPRPATHRSCTTAPQPGMRREGAPEAAPEALRQAVGGDYQSGWGRLQMPLRLALAVRGTVAGHRLGALEGGGGGVHLPPLPMHPWPAAWHGSVGRWSPGPARAIPAT